MGNVKRKQEIVVLLTAAKEVQTRDFILLDEVKVIKHDNDGRSFGAALLATMK